MAIVANRPTSFKVEDRNAFKPVVVRSITGSIAAESTTRTVAQFPVATHGFNFARFDSVLIGIEMGSGTGTVTLEPLVLDADGGLWMQMFAGAAPGLTLIATPARVVTPALNVGTFVEVPVWGQKVLFRVDAVSASPTNLQVIALPAKLRIGAYG